MEKYNRSVLEALSEVDEFEASAKLIYSERGLKDVGALEGATAVDQVP